MCSVSTRVDVMMLHLSPHPSRNQQAHARENRISGTITDRDVPLPNLPRRGLVFRFSPLVPCLVRCVSRPYVPFHHTRFFPVSLSSSSITEARSSPGVMGVPLLSGREHARKKTGKKSSLFSSFDLISLSLPRAFLFPFFNRSNFSNSVLPRCPCNHLYPRSDRTCPPSAVSEIFRAGPHLIPASELIHDRVFPCPKNHADA